MHCAKCLGPNQIRNGFADALCGPCRSQIMFDRKAKYLVAESVRMHRAGHPSPFDALLAFAIPTPQAPKSEEGR